MDRKKFAVLILAAIAIVLGVGVFLNGMNNEENASTKSSGQEYRFTDGKGYQVSENEELSDDLLKDDTPEELDQELDDIGPENDRDEIIEDPVVE